LFSSIFNISCMYRKIRCDGESKILIKLFETKQSLKNTSQFIEIKIIFWHIANNCQHPPATEQLTQTRTSWSIHSCGRSRPPWRSRPRIEKKKIVRSRPRLAELPCRSGRVPSEHHTFTQPWVWHALSPWWRPLQGRSRAIPS